jgi:hypothetical protein
MKGVPRSPYPSLSALSRLNPFLRLTLGHAVYDAGSRFAPTGCWSVAFGIGSTAVATARPIPPSIPSSIRLVMFHRTKVYISAQKRD